MKKITIADIILILLFLFAITLALWYIFGNSPTFEQVILGFVLPVIFGIAIKIAIIDTRLNYIEENIKKGFNKMREDINLIKNKIKA
tara:strand:- start:130 stop:390 length:261 start_codon:yes stop_codon:yes gene_type:complete